MATIQDAIKRLTYLFTSTGADQVAADLNKVGAAQANVAASADTTSRASLSLEKSFDSLERRYVSTVRAQQDFEKVQNTVNAAVKQNPELQDRANVVLAAAAAKFDAAKGSAGAFNAILDAGRGAALGYAAGIGPIGAVLGSFGPWGVAAAAGIGLVVNALDYMNTKANEIGTESSGLKQFADTTGLTVTQVRGLTEAGAELGIASDTVSSSIQKFTFSLDEARKGGGALFDQVQAIDGQLANDLASTRSGAEALDILTKAYNSTADATTKAAIAKAAFGKGGAAFGTVLNVVGEAGGVDAYSASVQKALGVTDEWTNKVAALRNENRSLESDLKLLEASIYSEAALERQNRFLKTQIEIAKFARDAANLPGGATSQQRNPFVQETNRSAGIEPKTFPVGGDPVADTGALEAATQATNDLTAARLESVKAEQAAATSTGNMVSLLGGAATGAEIAEARFHALTAAYLANKFGAEGSAEAIDKYNRALRGNTDNVVSSLQQQRAVIEAIGGAAKQAAQYALDYNNALRDHSPADAQLIAVEKLATAQAAANEAVGKQIESLKDQNAMIKAQQNGTEKSTAAAIAYKNAIASGADETSAAALATETAQGYTLRAAAAALEWQQNMLGVGAAAQQATASINAAMDAELNAKRAAQGANLGRGGDFGNFNANGQLDNQDEPHGFSADPRLNVSYAGGGGGKRLDLGLTYRDVTPITPDSVAGSYAGGGDYAGAIKAVENMSSLAGRYGSPGVDVNAQMSQVDTLTQLLNSQTSDKGTQLTNLQKEMAWLNTLPETIARDQKIVSLQQSIDQLKNSTDANTAATAATLNPLYSQGHGALAIGYYKAASGLDVVAQGPSSGDTVPFHAMVNGGERITITPPGKSGNDNVQSTQIINNNNFVFNNTSTNNARRSQRQFAQGFGQIAAAGS